MASRSLTVMLDAGRPDPEAREFKHSDPLGWTRANRPKILQALYTILVAGVRCRPDDAIPKTRFKTWWKLVGWPVEHAAGLWGHAFDCAALSRAEEAEDAENLAIAEFLAVCLRIWKRWMFQTRDVVQALPGIGDPNVTRDSAALSEALSEIKGEALDRVNSHSISKIFQVHVVDRTVWLPDGTTATLWRRTDHEANDYWVQVGDDEHDRAEPWSESSRERKPWHTRLDLRALKHLQAAGQRFAPAQGPATTSGAKDEAQVPTVSLGEDGKRHCSCGWYRQNGSCRHVRSRRRNPG
jgi:hypothetical protein